MAQESGWAIVGNCGLYEGWWQTQNDAIGEHVSQRTGLGVHCLGRRLSPLQAAEWKKLKRLGDRAVKVRITYKKPRP